MHRLPWNRTLLSLDKMKITNVNLTWRFWFWKADESKNRYNCLRFWQVLVPTRCWCAKSGWYFLISLKLKVSKWSDKNSVFFQSRHRQSPKALLDPAAPLSQQILSTSPSSYYRLIGDFGVKFETFCRLWYCLKLGDGPWGLIVCGFQVISALFPQNALHNILKRIELFKSRSYSSHYIFHFCRFLYY
jgi:hypothetical protein